MTGRLRERVAHTRSPKSYTGCANSQRAAGSLAVEAGVSKDAATALDTRAIFNPIFSMSGFPGFLKIEAPTFKKYSPALLGISSPPSPLFF